ncbi:MAG: DUF190 domain-containing protein [Acidimicrobiales bacterium]
MSDNAMVARMQRLTIMLGTRDRSHHHSLATEVLARAKKAHMAGATLLQAQEGQGRSGTVHRQHLFSEDASLSLIIVDSEDKISALLSEIDKMLGDALVILDDVSAFRV